MMDDFKSIHLVGKGGYGSIYTGIRKTDQKMYALKQVLFQELGEEEKFLSSFHHPHIIKYYDSFFEHDKLYIVMEYASGGDLGKLIKKNHALKRSFDENYIWSYFIQILLGINALHRKSDIKARNIFICEDNRLCIGDLGCAKHMKKPFVQAVVGTPYYMCPEVIQNRPYNFKCDIWSIGIVLYEIICLNVPFTGKDQKEVCKKILAGAYRPVPISYSSDLRSILSLCLNQNAVYRPSIDQLLSNPILISHCTKLIEKKIDFEKFVDRTPITEEISFSSCDFSNRLPTCKYTDSPNFILASPPVTPSPYLFKNIKISSTKPATSSRNYNSTPFSRPAAYIPSNKSNLVASKNPIVNNNKLNTSHNKTKTNQNFLTNLRYSFQPVKFSAEMKRKSAQLLLRSTEGSSLVTTSGNESIDSPKQPGFLRKSGNQLYGDVRSISCLKKPSGMRNSQTQSPYRESPKINSRSINIMKSEEEEKSLRRSMIVEKPIGTVLFEKETNQFTDIENNQGTVLFNIGKSPLISTDDNTDLLHYPTLESKDEMNVIPISRQPDVIEVFASPKVKPLLQRPKVALPLSNKGKQRENIKSAVDSLLSTPKPKTYKNASKYRSMSTITRNTTRLPPETQFQRLGYISKSTVFTRPSTYKSKKGSSGTSGSVLGIVDKFSKLIEYK